MSPIDDELRATLQGRARAVPPSPDPLLGIERRARRIRRNRVAASVAGSALAVVAIATAVPLLQSTPTSQPAPLASAEPTLVTVPTQPYALDPADPWPFRGDASLLEDGFPEAVAREVAAKRSVAESAVELTPLFAQVYEPSARPELVWLADVAGDLSWGVAQAAEGGPQLVWDEPLEQPALALAAPLPGDEVARLLVVAAPTTTSEYGPDGASEFRPMAELAVGVHITPLDGDAATDVLQVLGERAEQVLRVSAPDGPGPHDEGSTAEPANLLDWPSRGTSDAELEALLGERYAAAVGTQDGVSYRPLFTGDTDAGVRFTVGQAWVAGREANTVSLAVGGESGEQFLLGPVTDPETRVVVQLLCCLPGSSSDTLVVVPVPGTGQVLYDDDDSGEFRAVGEGQDHLDGVVLLDRDPRAMSDRLQLLDGDGDPARPLFQGPVFPLLCGVKECG